MIEAIHLDLEDATDHLADGSLSDEGRVGTDIAKLFMAHHLGLRTHSMKKLSITPPSDMRASGHAIQDFAAGLAIFQAHVLEDVAAGNGLPALGDPRFQGQLMGRAHPAAMVRHTQQRRVAVHVLGRPVRRA